VGICLVRNDDRFLNQVLAGVVDFCDELIIADHQSRDGTAKIAQKWAESHGHVSYHRIASPAESQNFISQYYGQDVWVFGVDGDELYEADRLSRFRQQLLEGRFSNVWQVLGKAVHCFEFDQTALTVTGHLARPSRSMTKLYNFSRITNWEGPTSERLHGGTIHFKPECEGNKDHSESEMDWDDALFRCVHMVFVRRSSQQIKPNVARPNIAEKLAFSKWEKIRYRLLALLGKEPASKTKHLTYARGEPRVISVASFIDPKNLTS
jgi:glycosyltransferase involved in cell wall biosynthesis